MEPLLLPARANSLIQKTTAKVASIIAQYSASRAELIKADLRREAEKLKLERKNVNEAQRKFKILKQKREFLHKQYETLTLRKPQLTATYKSTIQKLMQTNLIDEFAVDSKKRIIVTTKLLEVKKESWDRPRVAGAYQIRIDFSQNSYVKGIEIINITKVYKHYQSPTINNSSPCWGNIGADIEREFKFNDIYQLITDLIDYIKSPNDGLGYIHLPNKDKNTGWEQFLACAVNRPSGYSFKMYDRGRKTHEGPVIEFTPLTSHLSSPTITYNQYMDFAAAQVTASSTIYGTGYMRSKLINSGL
jgi:hypothetical protein